MRPRLVPVAALLAALSWPAGAPAQEPAEKVPFAIDPVGFSKGFFRFNTEPGGERTVQLRVSNLTNRSIEVEVRPVDVGTAASGGLDYGEGAPKGDGRWLIVETPTIELAPRTARNVPVTLKVPGDASPGEHYAAVVAIDPAAVREAEKPQPGGGTVNLRFLSRLAVPALIRLPGPTEAAIEASNPRIVSTPSGSYISIDLTNTGNIRIPKTTGRLTVQQRDKVIIDQGVSLEGFVPKTTISLPLPFTGQPVRDTYRITGTLRPEGAENVDVDLSVTFGDKEADDLEVATGQAPEAGGGGTPSWVWIAIALLVIALLALLAMLRRRAAGQAALAASAAPRTPATPQAPAPPAQAPVAPTGAIDINTAGADELQTLPGVGPAAAARIVAWREEYGSFASIDDLAKVEGFDADRVDGVRGNATI